MTPPDAPDEGRTPEVGSLQEETVRLLGALGEWAHAQQADPDHPSPEHPSADHPSAEQPSSGPTSDGECRYCPVCQVMHAVRATSPEVREHLATAATALLQVATELLATHVPRPGAPGAEGPRGAAVERIDLDEDPREDPS